MLISYKKGPGKEKRSYSICMCDVIIYLNMLLQKSVLQIIREILNNVCISVSSSHCLGNKKINSSRPAHLSVVFSRCRMSFANLLLPLTPPSGPGTEASWPLVAEKAGAGLAWFCRLRQFLNHWSCSLTRTWMFHIHECRVSKLHHIF